jgi:hypothetical protein
MNEEAIKKIKNLISKLIIDFFFSFLSLSFFIVPRTWGQDQVPSTHSNLTFDERVILLKLSQMFN